MNDQSDGTQGLRPLTPDDVPVADRWVCLTCGSPTRPGIPAIEHLLGGWVRAHCHVCGTVQTCRPAKTHDKERT